MGTNRAKPRTPRRAARPLAVSLAGTLALLVLAASLLAARSAAARPARDAPPVAVGGDALGVVVDLNAAWNRHDLEAVVAAFAPDAVVRQATPLTSFGEHVFVEDVYGIRLQVAAGGEPYTTEGADVVWRGRAAIRVWARGLFALRHRAEATGHAAEHDGQVTWRYRAHADPYQTVPGVPPIEGTAVATVRGAAIVALGLETAPGSIARRDAALMATTRVGPATQSAGSLPVFTAPLPIGMRPASCKPRSSERSTSGRAPGHLCQRHERAAGRRGAPERAR